MDIPIEAPEMATDPRFKRFGIDPSDVPSFAIETQPSDIVFFFNPFEYCFLILFTTHTPTMRVFK